MKSDTVITIVGLVFFGATGIWLTFFSERAREYYFRMYRKGIEDTGLLTSWIDKYPSSFVFRLTGILALIITLLLIFVFIKKISA